MPLNLRHIKANKRDRGIIRDTMSVVLHSAMKRKTMKVTNTIPSIKL